MHWVCLSLPWDAGPKAEPHWSPRRREMPGESCTENNFWKPFVHRFRSYERGETAMRVSPSMIVAGVALFVALSSGAYAGTAVLIGSGQIKNRSIRVVDMHPSTVRALRGQRGPRGARGATGAPGIPGAQGPPGTSGGFDPNKISYVTGPSRTFAPGEIGFVEAACPPNTRIVGGGYFSNILDVAADKTYDGATWSVMINNDTSISVTANAHAICAAP